MKRILTTFLVLFSISTQAGLPPTTLSGQAQATKPTTFTTQVPYRQATQISGVQSLIETGSENMLVNPGFEGVASTVPNGWTCTTGTCTKSTTAGTFSSGLASMLIVPAANALNVSQSVNTPSGIQKQGFARIIYRVPATCSTTFVIRTLVDGATQTEVPTASLIEDDTFRSIEVPLTFGATSAGIRVFANGTCTGNIYIDGAILAQGLGLQNLMLDNVYSARILASGSIGSVSKTGWISCTRPLTGEYTCTITGFTVVPNCSGMTDEATQGITITQSLASTASTLFLKVTKEGVGYFNKDFSLICQKSGNDYLAASSSVYSIANQNVSAIYTGAPPTGTLTSSFNTVTFGTRVKDTHNAYSSGTYTVPVTASYDISVGVAVTGTYNGAQQLATSIYINGTAKYQNSNAPTTSIGRAWTNLSVQSVPLVAGDLVTIRVYNDGTGLSYESNATTNYFSITRSDANVINGSFQDVPTVPGAGARIDTFSVTFGTTNATTVCSASPCSYLDQIGAAVTSVTRASTGNYTMNTSKTYTKLKCTISANSPGASPSSLGGSGAALNCSSCSSLNFVLVNPSPQTVLDSTGTLYCQGTF